MYGRSCQRIYVSVTFDEEGSNATSWLDHIVRRHSMFVLYEMLQVEQLLYDPMTLLSAIDMPLYIATSSVLTRPEMLDLPR